MEKTKEQKLASKERYLAKEVKVIKKLQANNFYDFIDGLKYALSFSLRYSKNFMKLIDKAQYIGNEPVELTIHYTSKCLETNILHPWQNTLWFDKEKAESLQQYILEHSN